MNQDHQAIPAKFSRADAAGELGRIGALDDSEIDIAETALVLATFERTRISLTRYRHHLSLLSGEVAREFDQNKGDGDNIDDRARALKTVVHGHYGYHGDELTYDYAFSGHLAEVCNCQSTACIGLIVDPTELDEVPDALKQQIDYSRVAARKQLDYLLR